MVRTVLCELERAEQEYTSSTFENGGIISVKGNVKTRGETVQNRYERQLFERRLAFSKCLGNYARFQWKGLLYEFCCFCFELPSAPRIFSKLSKSSIFLLRINEDLLTARDTLIVLLQHLQQSPGGVLLKKPS